MQDLVGTSLRQIKRTLNDAEWRVDLVSDGSNQLAEGGHLLALDQLRLGSLKLLQQLGQLLILGLEFDVPQALNFCLISSPFGLETNLEVSELSTGLLIKNLLSVRRFTPQSTTVTPPGTTATLTVTASGRSGERVLSNPSGISVAVGTTGSATFNAGTSITLSVTNGRDAIWSGACASGGEKRRTCTFTLTANAAVSVNVQ